MREGEMEDGTEERACVCFWIGRCLDGVADIFVPLMMLNDRHDVAEVGMWCF